MKIKLNNKQAAAKAAAIVLATGMALLGTLWGWKKLSEAGHNLAIQEQRVRQMPQTEARTAAVASELAKRQLDVQRIEAFLVRKDQLGDVVSEIEAAGAARGLSVSVPAVEEKPNLDEQGNEQPPSGPLYEVRLKLTARGSAKELLRFLHDLEHMQRLAYFESWRLDASEETARNQTAGTGALLLADFIVTVIREEGS